MACIAALVVIFMTSFVGCGSDVDVDCSSWDGDHDACNEHHGCGYLQGDQCRLLCEPGEDVCPERYSCRETSPETGELTGAPLIHACLEEDS
jgi:hypothetical protein